MKLRAEHPGDSGPPRSVSVLKSDLVIDPKFNARKETSGEDDKVLSDSIDRDGAIQDPVVRKLEDGRYALIAGFRRVATYPNDAHVTCKIIVVDDLGAFVVNLTENINRKGLKPWELAERLAMLSRKYRLTPKALASRVGLSVSYVSHLIQIKTKLIPSIWELYRQFGDSIASSDTLRSICCLPPDDQLAAWKMRDKDAPAGGAKKKPNARGRIVLERYRGELAVMKKRGSVDKAWAEGAMHGLAVALGKEKPITLKDEEDREQTQSG